MESVGSVPEVQALLDEIRNSTSTRILDGLGAGDPPPPKMRTAARAWLWFMDGAILDWLEPRDLTRTELRDLLLGTLGGSLTAANSGLAKRMRIRMPATRVSERSSPENGDKGVQFAAPVTSEPPRGTTPCRDAVIDQPK